MDHHSWILVPLLLRHSQSVKEGHHGSKDEQVYLEHRDVAVDYVNK